MRSNIDLGRLEAELKRRLELPEMDWEAQSDSWDRATRYIYWVKGWDSLLKMIEHQPEKVQAYAINRWFNFWSAMGVEAIFCSLPGVKPVLNQYDRLADFSIRGIRFDHKTSVFPKGYGRPVEYARAHLDDLIEWLYAHQSKEGRYHQGNRLFVVLHDAGGEHWRLRAELRLIRAEVSRYVAGFDKWALIRVKGCNPPAPLADVIWVTR